jgi:hypothetical protein
LGDSAFVTFGGGSVPDFPQKPRAVKTIGDDAHSGQGVPGFASKSFE